MTINEIFRQACEAIPQIQGFHYGTIPTLEANNAITYPAVVRLLRVTDELRSDTFTDEYRTGEEIVIAVNAEEPPEGDCEEALENEAIVIFFELLKGLTAAGLKFTPPTQVRWLRRATMAQALLLVFSMRVDNFSAFNESCVSLNYTD